MELMNKTVSFTKRAASTPPSLKLALQTRKEFCPDSWVDLVDLVKAFDTVNWDMLMKILPRFGLPDSLIDVIINLFA